MAVTDPIAAGGEATVLPSDSLGTIPFLQAERQRRDVLGAAKAKKDAAYNKTLVVDADNWSNDWAIFSDLKRKYYDTYSKAAAQAGGFERMSDQQRRQKVMDEQDIKDYAAISMTRKDQWAKANTQIQNNPTKYDQAASLERMTDLKNPREHAKRTNQLKEFDQLGALKYWNQYMSDESLLVPKYNPEQFITKNFATALTEMTLKPKTVRGTLTGTQTTQYKERLYEDVYKHFSSQYETNPDWREVVDASYRNTPRIKNKFESVDDYMSQLARNHALKQQKIIDSYTAKAPPEGGIYGGYGSEQAARQGLGITPHTIDWVQESAANTNVSTDDWISIKNPNVKVDALGNIEKGQGITITTPTSTKKMKVYGPKGTAHIANTMKGNPVGVAVLPIKNKTWNYAISDENLAKALGKGEVRYEVMTMVETSKGIVPVPKGVVSKTQAKWIEDEYGQAIQLFYQKKNELNKGLGQPQKATKQEATQPQEFNKKGWQ